MTPEEARNHAGKTAMDLSWPDGEALLLHLWQQLNEWAYNPGEVTCPELIAQLERTYERYGFKFSTGGVEL